MSWRSLQKYAALLIALFIAFLFLRGGGPLVTPGASGDDIADASLSQGLTPKHPVTIVTAFYDIGREKVDGRAAATYLQWFGITLQLRLPMVIYVDPHYAAFVRGERARHGLLNLTTLETGPIPYLALKARVAAILAREDYRDRMKDIARVECKLPLYNVVQYSKFKWLSRYEGGVKRGVAGGRVHLREGVNRES